MAVAVTIGLVSEARSKIVSAVIGATSPYRLERPAITSTLKVRVRGREVPRSRVDGFDYDPSATHVFQLWGTLAGYTLVCLLLTTLILTARDRQRH